jgi:carotenoid isomerooxygenase
MEQKNNIDEHLKQEAQEFFHDDHLGILPCEDRHGGHYPNVDLSIWLRSCIEEVAKPKKAKKLTGVVPMWLKGDLLQNGPGKFYFGNDVFQHLFDGSALVQKFAIRNGKIHYQCRFLRTKSFEANLKNNAIMMNEFATNAHNDNRIIKDDESKAKKNVSLRDRLAVLASGLEGLMSDNAMISIYPLGDKYYCFYESPFIQRIDPYSLSTMDRVDLNKKLGVYSHCSHPHYDQDGNMFTIGVKVGFSGPEYVVSKIPAATEAFDGGETMARVRSRWMFEPGYMHSFAVTENYFILVEQPLTIHAPSLAKGNKQQRKSSHRPHLECGTWLKPKCNTV